MDNCLSRLIVDYLKENIMAIFERIMIFIEQHHGLMPCLKIM